MLVSGVSCCSQPSGAPEGIMPGPADCCRTSASCSQGFGNPGIPLSGHSRPNVCQQAAPTDTTVYSSCNAGSASGEGAEKTKPSGAGRHKAAQRVFPTASQPGSDCRGRASSSRKLRFSQCSRVPEPPPARISRGRPFRVLISSRPCRHLRPIPASPVSRYQSVRVSLEYRPAGRASKIRGSHSGASLKNQRTSALFQIVPMRLWRLYKGTFSKKSCCRAGIRRNKKGNRHGFPFWCFPGAVSGKGPRMRLKRLRQASQLSQAFFCLNFWAAFMLCW